MIQNEANYPENQIHLNDEGHDQLLCWLRIDQVKYLKTQHLLDILEHISLVKLISQPPNQLRQFGFKAKQIEQILQPDQARIDYLLAWANQPNQHIIHWQHPAYPESLRHIASPPTLLYAIGDVALLSKPQIAIVGSRNASHYGLDCAYQFGQAIAQTGLVVTSGFATGVDGKAHMGALQAAGKTIAVLGTGPDVVYPKRHTEMATELARNGLLVSEFAPGTPPRAQHFPRRNRIISGMSLGVLVVEAALQSGSLITARYALEQNKEVFAIPNAIHDPRSKGCHQLIRDGAKLTESIADILEELPIGSWQAANNSVTQLSEKSQPENFTSEPLLDNLSYEVTSVDELVARSQLPVDVLLTRLLDLELQGFVAAVSGGYVRTRRE